jgi:hypothetical protein
MTTLLDILRNPNAVNHQQAKSYVEKQGDKLRLLEFFLAENVCVCARALIDTEDNDATPLDTPLLTEAEMERPLLELATRNPRALYAFNDAILEHCEAHMPGVDPEIFARIRMWNAIARQCYCMPPAMALLVFAWISTAHSGVVRMMVDTEPADSWWRQERRLEKLAEFFAAHITEISNRDASTAVYHACALHAALCYVVDHRLITLIEEDGKWRAERMPKKLKTKIVAEHEARRKKREADAVTAVAATEEAAPRKRTIRFEDE